MTVQDALGRGDLRTAIDRAGVAVRDRPLDAAARSTLVDLLGFAGDWARAEKQVEMLADAPGGDTYRALVRAGRDRAAFFGGGAPPPPWVVGPPAWAGPHLSACEHLRRGDHEAARADLDAVEAAREDARGTVAGAEFAGLRDLDDRLGPVLELVGAGGYGWVAWEDVRFLDVAPPEALRDLLWAPARVALAGGPIGWAYLPTVYPGSEAAAAPLQLGRATDWREAGPGLAAGLGLKVFLAGERSLGLFEVRDLRINPPGGEPAAGG